MRWLPLLLAASAGWLSAAQYTMDLNPANTSIRWTVSDPLHTVHGTFKLASGNIAFDTSTGKASGKIVVDVASGESGNGARDRRMQANVLEVRKYPEAVFVPDRIDGALAIPGSSHVQVHGTFTIHGAAHELTMDANTQATDNSMKANLSFAIPYVAWGMKDPSNFLLRVSKVVDVSVETDAPLLKTREAAP